MSDPVAPPPPSGPDLPPPPPPPPPPADDLLGAPAGPALPDLPPAGVPTAHAAPPAPPPPPADEPAAAAGPPVATLPDLAVAAPMPPDVEDDATGVPLPPLPDVSFTVAPPAPDDTGPTLVAPPPAPDDDDWGLEGLDGPDLPLPDGPHATSAVAPDSPDPAADAQQPAVEEGPPHPGEVVAYRGVLTQPMVHSICSQQLRADRDEAVPALAAMGGVQKGEVAFLTLSARPAGEEIGDEIQKQLDQVSAHAPIETDGPIKKALRGYARWLVEAAAFLAQSDSRRRERPKPPWAKPDPLKPKPRHEVPETEQQAAERARQKVQDGVMAGGYYEARLYVGAIGSPDRRDDLDRISREVISAFATSYSNSASRQGWQFEPAGALEATAGLMPVEMTKDAICSPIEMGEMMKVPDAQTIPSTVIVDRGKRVKWPDEPIIVPDVVNPPPGPTGTGVIPFGIIRPGTSREQAIGMPIDGLKTHMYLCGTTGSGKSTILESFIYGLARNGRCIFVVDPHGTLADNGIHSILSFYPDRADDILIIDFGDRDWPVSFNPIAIENAGEIEGTVQSVKEMILKMLNLSPDSAPRAVNYTEQAVWALCEANLRGFSAHREHALNLLDVPTFLTNADFRALVMQFCSNLQVISNFGPEGTYEQLGERQQVDHVMPVLRTFGTLGTKDSFANVFGQSESKIDFAKWVREKKLVFLKLPAIASDAAVATFVGAMVTPMLITSLSQWGHDPDLAAFLLVDEFQNYATESYKHLLAQTRKHGLHGISANQVPADLQADVLRGVQSNTQTKISMRLDPAAVKMISDFIASGRNYPSTADIVGIDNYWGWANVMVGGGKASGPFVFKGLPPFYEPWNQFTKHLQPEAEQRYEKLLPQVQHRSRMATALPVDTVRERLNNHVTMAKQVMENKIRERTRAGKFSGDAKSITDIAKQNETGW